MKKDDAYPFEEERLRAAAERVAGSLLDALPEEAELPPLPETLRKRMEASLLRRQARDRRLGLLRAAAAVLAVVVALAGLTFATDTEARADFRRWISRLRGEDTVYQYYGPAHEEPLPELTFGWLPEGCVLSEVIQEENSRRVIYENEHTSDYVNLLYGYMEDGLESTVTAQNGVPVSVGGKDGWYYPAEQGTSALGWFDDEAGIYYGMMANLDLKTMLRIAENLRPAG